MIECGKGAVRDTLTVFAAFLGFSGGKSTKNVRKRRIADCCGSHRLQAFATSLTALGAIDFYTIGGKERMIGNYAFRLGEESGGSTIVGFENHSGRTFLGTGVRPLGKIIKGYGNNGKDRTEGVRYKNAFCTYSHGPVLPKNPAFADTLIETALKRKYGTCSLDPLQDNFERLAHDTVLKQI